MEIPLFPLHAVLCPGIALPLHVFEPRYRLLVDRCLETSSPFGIVLILEGREVGSTEVSIASVGTFAEIRESSRYPDGRYDLLVVGTARFAIDSVDPAAEPYLVAQVRPLEDEVGEQAAASALAGRTMRRFVAYLQLLQPMEGETAEEIDVRVEVESESESESDPGSPEGDPTLPEIETEIGGVVGAASPDDDDPERAAKLDAVARRLVIPDDPTTLSYLLSGIIQVDPQRRQRLLEVETTEERLAALDALIGRELWMLRRRLRWFAPESPVPVVRRN